MYPQSAALPEADLSRSSATGIKISQFWTYRASTTAAPETTNCLYRHFYTSSCPAGQASAAGSRRGAREKAKATHLLKRASLHDTGFRPSPICRDAAVRPTNTDSASKPHTRCSLARQRRVMATGRSPSSHPPSLGSRSLPLLNAQERAQCMPRLGLPRVAPKRRDLLLRGIHALPSCPRIRTLPAPCPQADSLYFVLSTLVRTRALQSPGGHQLGPVHVHRH